MPAKSGHPSNLGAGFVSSARRFWSPACAGDDTKPCSSKT